MIHEKDMFGYHSRDKQLYDDNVFCHYCLENDHIEVIQWGGNTKTGTFDKNVVVVCYKCKCTFPLDCKITIEEVPTIIKKLRFTRIE